MAVNEITTTQLQGKLINCVYEAIERFNSSEFYLIKNNISERSICSRFAKYLENVISCSEFSEYIVDVEYNRGYNGDEQAVKRLQGKNITVDLIVHKRGYNPQSGFDNLICIEMKKADAPKGKIKADEKRLDMLTQNEYGFCYKAGFMIIIESNPQIDIHRLTVKTVFLNCGF